MPKSQSNCWPEMPVKVTESAKKQINTLCETTGSAVRLAINSGGCQGFSKSWELTTDIADDDIILEMGLGKLVVDPVSLDIIDDAVIDYKNNLSGSYFTVDIPSAISTCGCGTSFSI